MPRNGSSIYYYPPGTEGFPDTTIESEKYNTYITDVAADLNLPRPVVVGGTGASDAKNARKNLDTEVASQTVTNYDTHVFESGSFWSQTNATGGPVAGHAFSGNCVVVNHDPGVIVITARDINDVSIPGRVYVREKYVTWGPWTQDNTGVTSPTPPVDPPVGLLWWNSTDGQLYVYYDDGNSKQWVVASPSPDPRQFVRKSGDSMTGGLGVSGGITAVSGNIICNSGDMAVAGAGNPAVGTIYFGNTGSRYLQYNGTSWLFNGGGLAISSGGLTISSGDIICASGRITVAEAGLPTHGTMFFGNSGNGYLQYTGTSWFLNGGGFSLGSGTFIPPNAANGGFRCKDGTSNAVQGNYFNILYTAGLAYLYVDTTQLGAISVTSDYRIKKDIAPLPSTWDAVKALRPIKYTHKNYTPDKATELLVVGDNEERWGFVAHELQETLVPSASSGKKDDDSILQSPNPLTIIAALTKTLQEAMARIEALEAKV